MPKRSPDYRGITEHLEEAVETSDNPEVNYHIREALQKLSVPTDEAETKAQRGEPSFE